MSVVRMEFQLCRSATGGSAFDFFSTDCWQTDTVPAEVQPINRPQRPTLSLTSAVDGVGGQRHAPTVLPSGINGYPLYRKLGGLQKWTVVENLAPNGIQSPQSPASSESLYRLSHTGPQYCPCTRQNAYVGSGVAALLILELVSLKPLALRPRNTANDIQWTEGLLDPKTGRPVCEFGEEKHLLYLPGFELGLVLTSHSTD